MVFLNKKKIDLYNLETNHMDEDETQIDIPEIF